MLKLSSAVKLFFFFFVALYGQQIKSQNTFTWSHDFKQPSGMYLISEK